MKSIMTHAFANLPNVEIQRSSFDRSHGYKTTFDAGYLIPFFVDEALPGDTFSVNITGFARLATPIYPLMDNMFMETFFFAVPNRLVWINWKKFMGEQVNPGDHIDYTVPMLHDVTANGKNFANGTIFDYLGIPTKIDAQFDFSALPLRAYNLIYNEWFRDENLQDSVTVNTGDTDTDATVYTILRRGKRHDYFTSALPWTQKGDDVLLSLGDTAPVLGIGKYNSDWDASNKSVWESGTNIAQTYNPQRLIGDSASANYFYIEKDPSLNSSPWIRADLSNAIGPSVNELREAIQIQRLLEKDARSGTRYTEIIQAHFGVSSPDMRLQRPEYLGGGSSPIHITPVPNTTGANTPGKLSAYGLVGFSGHGFTKSFTEHTILIGIINVRADLTYQYGLNKMWTRETRYDFYWPTLAHLGEQAILNKELYLDATSVGNNEYNEVFGYQERYSEYRYKPSMITGIFRSNDATSLDAWHLALEFAGTPTLDETFIVDDPPIDRVIATPTEPHFLFDSYIQMRCARPMPVYSIPGLMDHF